MEAEQKRLERRAKWFWVSLICGLLGMQLVIGGVALYLSTSDPSMAVIPDYYEKSLAWDETKQARGAAERLGLSLQLQASDVVDQKGMRALELRVFDSLGQPVDGLNAYGAIYHHARANQQYDISLQSVGEGRYLVLAPMRRNGVWQVELAIEGAAEPISVSQTLATTEA